MVDVSTEQRVSGNRLEAFPHPRGLSDRDMQALVTELNRSETTLVLPLAPVTAATAGRTVDRTHELPVRRPCPVTFVAPSRVITS